MKTKLYLGLLASSLLAVAAIEGCGSDTSTSSTGTTSASGTGGGSATASGTGGEASTSSGSTSGGTGGSVANPVPPKLGKQIDRFGRPAINTALNHTFDVDPAKGMGKDAYNQEGDPTKWVALSAAEFSKNLAILDGLDTVCGNQLLAGSTPVAGRYSLLAGALSDDRVYVDTSATACTTYLAVEANATMLMPNMDCGGRKLNYDVIDASYSALAAGAFSGVGDGVTPDVDTTGTAFPYLAAPH